MVKKAKDKRFLFFPFFVYEVAVYFFGLFDVCVKQCCPTINRNFILPEAHAGPSHHSWGRSLGGGGVAAGEKHCTGLGTGEHTSRELLKGTHEHTDTG